MKLEVLEFLPDINPKEHPLLFVHGGSHGAWAWKENFLPYFASKGFPSYALSLRGHGESEGYENLHHFSFQDYAEDVLSVMMRLKNKPVLIGHSMGGAIVQKVLQSNQDKIEAVVLMASTPPQGMLKDMLRLVFTNFKKVSQLKSFNKGKTNKFPDGVFFSEELPAEKRDEFSKLLQFESDRIMLDSAREIVPKPININVPILVLGSKKDWFFPERTVMAVGKTYKTKPVIFPDVCHDMMLDPNWRIVADEILAFLENLGKI